MLQLFELGLAMLGAVKGSVIIFLDTRLHGSKIDMVNEARALVGLFDRADIRRWRVVITVMYPNRMHSLSLIVHSCQRQRKVSVLHKYLPANIQ